MYLCVLLDLNSRRVVGWSMRERIDTVLVQEGLWMACLRPRPPRGVIFHSDRGTQYCSADFRDMVDAHGFLRSMSRKGDSWDNACAERFFKTLKSGLIRAQIYSSREEARAAIFEYVEVFHNRVGLHSYLGYLRPVEYEEQSGARKVS